MKKITFILVIVFLNILVMQSCKKDILSDNSQINQNTKNKQDIDFKNLAKIVSIAINENPNFRKTIKDEALIKFDGDYDILLKSFKNKTFKNRKNSMKIGEFLSNYAKNLNIGFKNDNKSSAQDYIDYLTNLYPNLQISVPIHAKDWNDSYIPKVAIIPSDFNEQTTTTVPGYINQNEIEMNVVDEPNEPVVVIGMNERVGIDESDLVNVPPIIYNWNIQGIQTQTGIKIQWSYSGYQNDIFGYRIFRKENTSNTFVRIANVLGINNMVYDDLDVEPNKYYSYYVVAFNDRGDSTPSSIVNVQAPNYPQSVSSFSTQLHTPSLLEVKWGLPTNQAVDFVRIEKMVINQTNNYNLVHDFNPNTLNYLDNNVIAGKKVIYRSSIYNGGSHSNYEHDFVIVPYRDISIPTKTYVKEISFNHSDLNTHIEHWLRGAPEFKLAVVMGNPNSGITIQDMMLFEFDSRHSSQTFTNRNIYDWQPDDWSEVLTMKVVEWDGGSTSDLNLSAKFKQKNALKTGFDIDGSVNVTVNDFLGSKDDDIGIGYLKYYDPQTHWVEFSNYGFKMKISTND